MNPKTIPCIESQVAGGIIRLPAGLGLAEGAAVLVMPLDWLKLAGARPVQPRRGGKKRGFASEDLIGCHEGDGKAATNAAVRSRLRARAGRGA